VRQRGPAGVVTRSWGVARRVARAWTVSAVAVGKSRKAQQASSERYGPPGLASYVYSRSSVRRPLSLSPVSPEDRSAGQNMQPTLGYPGLTLYCKSALLRLQKRKSWMDVCTVHWAANSTTSPENSIAWRRIPRSMRACELFVRTCVVYCAFRPGGLSYLRMTPVLRRTLSKHACNATMQSSRPILTRGSGLVDFYFFFFKKMWIVALSFVFDKYCLIID